MAQRAVAEGAASCVQPFARRRLRLRLDELEPRVAPSSLLCNLPLLDAWGMEHGAWGERDFGVRNAECGVGTEHGWGDDGTRMSPPRRTPWRADDADSGADTASTTAYQASAVPSEGFAPVVPSQLDRADGNPQTPSPRLQVSLDEPTSNPPRAVRFGVPGLESEDYLESGAWDSEFPGSESGSDGLIPAIWDNTPDLTGDPHWPTGSPAHSLTVHDHQPSVGSAFRTSRQVSDFFDPVD